MPNSTAPGKLGEEIWAVRSTDAGLTFGTPYRLTPTVQIPPGRGKNGIQLQLLAIGGGIEISRGPHAGRLIVQGYAVKCFQDPSGNCNKSAVAAHMPMNGFAGESPVGWAEINYVLMSDDGGLTWKASEVFGVTTQVTRQQSTSAKTALMTCFLQYFSLFRAGFKCVLGEMTLL